MNVPGTTVPNIETKVFIRGQDAKALDVNAIVTHMTAIQNHIKTLEVVETPSEAVKKMIADGKKDLVDIAKYLDSHG